MLLNNKIKKTNEQGRSMVEMLGVLAIIGVLSVGGLYGYGVAMKKHKANELLHQASMLATTISAQAMSNDGKLPETITSFGNSNYGTFSTSTTDALDGKGFSITIENVDSAVCDQLKKGGMVQNVDCNPDAKTATITYYKNLATTEAEGEKSPTGEKPDPACANVTCPEGSTCSRGQCQCSNGLFVCGEQCCAEGTYCTGPDTSTYTCAKPTSGCTKNSDCKDAEGNVDTSKFCNVSEDLGTGTCTDKGTLTPYTLKLPKGDLTVYKSSGEMNWWSAVNFCEAHDKKQLVTMADLGISDPAGKDYCYFDSAKRVDLGDDETYQCNCTGDSGCTTTTTELYNKLGTSGYHWLADNSNAASYFARVLYFFGGAVSEDYRPAPYLHVLCR